MALSHQQVEAAYRTYGHLVLRRCRAIMRDEQAADDAMQDVFVKLMKYGDSFVEASSPLGWLYRAASNVCFDLLKKRKPVAEVKEERITADVSPDTAIAERDVVLWFLNQLDRNLQRVAVLYFIDELPQDRIARETGWSRQTVNKKIQHIRHRATVLKTTMGIA